MSTITRPLGYFTRDAGRIQTNKRLRDALIEKIEQKSSKPKRHGSVRLIQRGQSNV